ncbi:hypothetical protein [Streptomyces sp. NPDC096132]|uniref:hypothetical protein n=1 Tax=Streptomyces sp. NPDC096132 TaxID=3366075 RepID=UPI003819C014
MNHNDRALHWLYLLGGALTALCATTSARHGAYWYAAGLAAVTFLLVIAAIREYVDADERRAAAVRAERAVRVRALSDERQLRQIADSLGHSCCERWWTSCGAEHASTCRNQGVQR